MDPSHQGNVTQLLGELRSPAADHARIREQLYSAVYEELRRVAGAIMRGEDLGRTLQPTALVNEAFLKLVNVQGVEWRDRVHFLAIATRAMRQVLVDHARRRDAEKRGGSVRHVLLDETIAVTDAGLDIIELDDVLERLTRLNERMGRVVELRVFGGLTNQDIAEALSVSARTVRDDWFVARRWLARQLET